MTELICPQPGCDWTMGSICGLHSLDLVAPGQKWSEPQSEDPVTANPGQADDLDPFAGAEALGASQPENCWHCGAPIPDPAAKLCVHCAEPLIRLPLVIEFSGGRIAVAVGDRTPLGRSAAESPHARLFASFSNVSRLHATIGMDHSGGAWIRDEESNNGTFVNGALIVELKPYPLADGDEVRLGADATGRVALRPLS
jgi:FHA domain